MLCCQHKSARFFFWWSGSTLAPEFLYVNKNRRNAKEGRGSSRWLNAKVKRGYQTSLGPLPKPDSS